MKVLLVLAIILTISFIFLFMTQNQKTKVCFDDYCFDAETATAIPDQIRGLSGRKSLEENQGMLFVYKNPKEISIWMKGMKFPLDIIWLGADKKVVYIEREAKPCDNNCQSIKIHAQYVLEVNTGSANSLAVGDQAKFEL